jgi:hypothetical protein
MGSRCSPATTPGADNKHHGQPTHSNALPIEDPVQLIDWHAAGMPIG